MEGEFGRDKGDLYRRMRRLYTWEAGKEDTMASRKTLRTEEDIFSSTMLLVVLAKAGS